MVKDVTAVVAAASPNRGIGYQGQLPWRLPADLKHFQRVTQTPPQPHLTNAIVMGRKTWQSLPNGRPLKGRINVVLTTSTDLELPTGVVRATDWQDAETQLADMGQQVGQVFCIGGAQVYQAALQSGCVNRVIYTQVEAVSDTAMATLNQCDVFFPELPDTQWEKKPYYDTVKPQDKNGVDKENDSNTITATSNGGVDTQSGLRYSFWEYTRKQNPTNNNNLEEEQYLALCRDILESGIPKGDRTGTGTLSKFGTQMRFNLRHGTLPLLTTKRVFWRGVAEELLWFISGNTNANDLAAKDIHIWDGNGSREFLDQRGLSHREVGDLGPVYGFQWRHFGANYVDFHTDYTGQGVDQLAECIDKIKHHPDDRRIILSAWNPTDLSLMALPPCHMFCQFYVDTVHNEVSCQMYQRSADMGLGVPFNIASYALLTHMIAHVTDRKPGDLVHTIGDAHVYLNHVQALQEQMVREPRPFPQLKINPAKQNIDDFEFSDFEVIGYNPHKAIKMKMAV